MTTRRYVRYAIALLLAGAKVDLRSRFFQTNSPCARCVRLYWDTLIADVLRRAASACADKHYLLVVADFLV